MMNGIYKLKSELIITSADKGREPNVKMIFVCDPALNTECNKRHCGEECTFTANIRFAKRFELNE